MRSTVRCTKRGHPVNPIQSNPPWEGKGRQEMNWWPFSPSLSLSLSWSLSSVFLVMPVPSVCRACLSSHTLSPSHPSFSGTRHNAAATRRKKKKREKQTNKERKKEKKSAKYTPQTRPAQPPSHTHHTRPGFHDGKRPSKYEVTK
ncbi:hypothetical protein LX32DRAFT_340363 [Colletotrichum zoysiae]|uniref:Uncharacterized protein n=1 Tax=Colletotrichum zoysiae TaxID=1216348 RepID=A0AAD9M520_9PEZI|nr:hypothetical protein LX32DRAFT_340363 [Colletotrichum zoysiae]